MPDRVVVCGGGIIGVATAYYLTLHGVRPTLVEKKGIACAASGVTFSQAQSLEFCKCSSLFELKLEQYLLF